MKKSILPLVTSILAISLLIGGYKALRGDPKSNHAGARIADTETESDSFRGLASFYGVDSNGTCTASGVPLNDSVSTAAHRTLPFGTLVRVTNLSNGSHETVRITDRGPFVKERIIDLSRNAAEKLGMIKAGITSVKIEVLSEGSEPTQPFLAKGWTLFH
jgi:rare lipoprotein A